MAEIAVPIVADHVGAPAASWIKRQIIYVIHFKRNVDKFSDQLRNLKLKKERIERDVDDATRSRMEVIHRDVEDWLKHVTTVDEDASRFLEETERAKKGCFFGFCPNVKARYQLSKKAEDASKAAADLLAGQFSSVSYRAAPQGLRFSTIEDYETFKSRARCMEEIMKGLKDPNVSMIGVWGMGGVGKTTLVKKAAEQVNVDRIFDAVIFSEVSLNQDVGRIQGEIADALGLKFIAETIVGRSYELRERLQKEKKILVILDNIWASLDLGKLGIPFGDDSKGCKILMTSRDGQVLSSMGTNSLNIRVDALDDGEAGNLFEKMAGDVVKAPNLQTLAFEIAKRCAGLPILIVTVARALRDRNDSHTWRVALRQLEEFKGKQFDEQVYLTLELSYNRLKSDMIKQLFLLCGLLVNTDYAIEDLFIYCMSLASFKDLGCLEDGRDELHKSIKDLVSSCFLLDGEKNGYIKMHDVVRKFAVSFACEKHNMFIEDYDGELEEWPIKNTVAKYSMICFPHNYIHRLLEGLECEELKLFILHSKNRDLEIPSSFFQGLRGIIVLDIKNIIIPSLPSSLCYLGKLRTLSLEGCDLEDISIIGNLVGLELLRIVNTNLSHLPEEISQLTGLKLFIVSQCSNLKVIPPNVFSSLTRLEELSMEESFVDWETEGVHCQNACLADLNKLSGLTSLDIHILNSRIIMANDFFSVKLERFKILIGDDWGWEWSSKYETSQRLKLKLSTSIHLKRGVKEILLKKTEDLYLDEVVGVNSVSELYREGFPGLRCLHVQRGRNFQYIVSSNTRVPCHIFPYLEVLSLKELTNLEMICRGQLGVESFNKLRTVKVKKCDKLKNLFSFTIVKSHLLQLQEIEVENCDNMEEIFSCESEEDRRCDIVIELMQVHSLHLKVLPKITSFCSEAKNAKQKLQKGDSSGSSQNLELMIKDEPISLLNGKTVFPNLRDLQVSGCNKLKFLFPIGVVKSLIQLNDLDVRDCESMEGIIEEVANHMIFPKLHKLHLDGLPKLKRFCTGNSIEFPSLSAMRTEGCPELKSFVFDEMEVSNDDLSRPLFDEKTVFPNLRDLLVWGCNKSKFLFPVGVVTSLIQLEELWVRDCELVEGIIEGVAGSMILHKLDRLYLDGLPKLKRFCTGNSIEFSSLSDMWIYKCPELKSFVFDEKEVSSDDLPPPLFDEKVELPTIETLSIESNNVKRIWHNELAPDSFCKLDRLLLCDCENLLNVFPSNMLTRLQNLRELKIGDCKSMDVIFDLEGVVDADVRVEFPKVTSLRLKHLPRLRSFYPGIHTSEWPLLKRLKVTGCEKLKIFASERSTVQEGAHDERPLFLLEKDIFPNLEELSLTWNYTVMNEMWHGEFLFEAFCRLKSLKVIGSTSFPPGFFKKLPNLEKLFVSHSYLEEIFSNGGVIDEAGELSTFCTLKTLRVKECHRLKILFPSSTAKSMTQLQELCVIGCEMMTSSVECVGEGEAEDDIIFPQLKNLYISSMPKLSGFCGSGKLAFKLPSLERVILEICPNLKTFCEGPLSTFKLRSVSVSSETYDSRWNINLNTTIQALYKERMTIRIQGQFRTLVARRDFIALRMASIAIQSAVRGNNARKFFESLKGDIALN